MITGDQIKAARERVGENQTDFAKRFGVTQAHLSRWETGQVLLQGSAEKLAERILEEIEAAQ